MLDILLLIAVYPTQPGMVETCMQFGGGGKRLDN